MAYIDRERLHWIGQNLKITHDQLSHEEAREWLQFMMRDKEAFMRYAAFGFILRRQLEADAKQISPAEAGEFLDEFAMKIQLANRERILTVSLPLFDIVGTDVLAKLGIVFAPVFDERTGGAQ